MNNLERISKIDPSQLSGEHYFQSLLEQALLCGLLSDKDQKKIQLEILALLARETERYNRGKSSSIRVEMAQTLLASISFTIGMELKTYTNLNRAVGAVRREKMEDLFEKGLRQIYAKKMSTKGIHARLVHRLVETPNIFYRSSAVDGILGFFKLYSPEFGAHEIHITADYPTCNGVTDLVGIEFIRKYVGNLYYENLFCTNFAAADIHHLLCGLDANYQNLLINIYEPVLTSALGCVLNDKDPHTLALSTFDIAHLQQLFKNKTAAKTNKILIEALNKVATALTLSDDLLVYLKGSLPIISATIQNAMSTETLHKVFLEPSYPESAPQIAFSYGEKMENDPYRTLIEEINECQTVQDKIDVIKESVHSLADLEDILLDADFTAEETAAVFELLSPIEYAALLKHHPYRELDEQRESEKQLRFCLKKYTGSLSQEQQQWLAKTVKMLQDETSLN